MSNLVCPWLHSGVRCDGCGVTPVSGYRYVCQVRPDFDLCSSCFRREAPGRQQQFLKITRNNISQPFQIEYIDCHDCGVAPIEGPRYQHKTRANYDLCEVCFKSATTSRDSRAPLNAQESHYEKIDETKIRSLRKKQTPAQLGFNHDIIFIKNQEFVAAYRPDPSRVYHLRVMCCVDCGPTLPIYGPAYKHQRKENKARCVSCYLNLKEEKKCHYARVDPPRSLETASPYRFQPSLPCVAHNASQVSTSASHATPHVSRSNSAPVPWSLRGAPSHVLPPRTTRSYSMPTAPPTFHQSPSSYYSYGQQSGSVQPNGSHPGSYQNSTRYGTYQSPYSQHPANMHNAAAASATAAATDAASQRYSTMYHHSVAQSAQMQQQMIMNAKLQNLLRHSHQSQNSSQYMRKILDNLSNIGGTGGGGVDYSTLTGGGGGGPGGGGVDYSSLMGAALGAAGGGVDLSSIMGVGGASAAAVIGNLVSNFGGLGLI